MAKQKNVCCNSNSGIWPGIFYGLLPHFFCIAFILFSAIGAITITAFLKKALAIPYFFHFLVIISLVMATISAIIYLRKSDCLCVSGIRAKWKYLTILYSVTILINLSMFFVVFPVLANVNTKNFVNQENYSADLSLAVQIPCSGHAPLIIDELEKAGGIGSVEFEMPDIFKIKYDPKITSPEKITELDIFKTYRAIIK
jgi:hypothetical protein